jgi:hypothetical protein
VDVIWLTPVLENDHAPHGYNVTDFFSIAADLGTRKNYRAFVEAAHDRDIPAFPGAFTLTEIQRAHEAGANLIKVFSASTLGMDYFGAVLAPLPHLKLMPTGGDALQRGRVDPGGCQRGGRRGCPPGPGGRGPG